MSRTIAFTSYFDSTNRFARASSSSGFVGGLVERTSSTGSTIPRPRKRAHSRFTRLRAKNGLSAAVIQSART